MRNKLQKDTLFSCKDLWSNSQGNKEEQEQTRLLNSFSLPPAHAVKQELTQSCKRPGPILYSCVEFFQAPICDPHTPSTQSITKVELKKSNSCLIATSYFFFFFFLTFPGPEPMLSLKGLRNAVSWLKIRLESTRGIQMKTCYSAVNIQKNQSYLSIFSLGVRWQCK